MYAKFCSFCPVQSPYRHLNTSRYFTPNLYIINIIPIPIYILSVLYGRGKLARLDLQLEISQGSAADRFLLMDSFLSV